MTQDQTQVLVAVETMTAAFMAKDIETVMQAYEPGAVVAFEPGQPIGDAATLVAMPMREQGIKYH